MTKFEFYLNHSLSSLCRLLVGVQQFTWCVWLLCSLLHSHCKWPPMHGTPTILVSTSSPPYHHRRRISSSRVALTLQPSSQWSVIPFPWIHMFIAWFTENNLWTATSQTTWQPRILIGMCTAVARHVVSIVTGISKPLSCSLVQEEWTRHPISAYLVQSTSLAVPSRTVLIEIPASRSTIQLSHTLGLLTLCGNVLPVVM